MSLVLAWGCPCCPLSVVSLHLQPAVLAPLDLRALRGLARLPVRLVPVFLGIRRLQMRPAVDVMLTPIAPIHTHRTLAPRSATEGGVAHIGCACGEIWVVVRDVPVAMGALPRESTG